MTIDVGGHLKAVRIMYGLSQRELAKRAGVTNGTISLIEQNRVSPSVSSLKKVLDGIPMSLAEFFTLDLHTSPQVFYSRVGGQVRVLGAGDAYYFQSTVPHRFHNPGSEPCEIISASTPPTF